jgi:hypothetical protein
LLLFLNQLCADIFSGTNCAPMEKPRTGGTETGLLRFLWGNR